MNNQRNKICALFSAFLTLCALTACNAMIGGSDASGTEQSNPAGNAEAFSDIEDDANMESAENATGKETQFTS